MKQTILGVEIDSLSYSEALKEIETLIKKAKVESLTGYVVKPNAEIVTYAYQNPEMKTILNRASLSLADGIGLLIASRFLGKKLKDRIGDVSLMEGILEVCEKNNFTIGLFGGEAKVNKELAERIEKRYKKINILIRQAGFDFNEEKLIAQLKQERPDVLFLALGFPKQEKWIAKYYQEINLPLMIAEGGSFDFFAGKLPRAPKLVRKLGLEWLFRLIRQPKRLKRQTALIRFVYLVLKEKTKTITTFSKN